MVKVTRMARIKVSDMAYGRLRAPDLDVMEEFLTRFGMVRAERTNTGHAASRKHAAADRVTRAKDIQ